VTCVEELSLNLGSAQALRGNQMDNTLYGNALDNVLDGHGGADVLSGLGGHDTFVFKAGQAQGDTVYEFDGSGPAGGDLLRFEGFGTLAEGASFVQQSADTWLISSADGTVQESITVFALTPIDAGDVLFV
jgi:Ca2+-binding RTX toxin-like protein